MRYAFILFFLNITCNACSIKCLKCKHVLRNVSEAVFTRQHYTDIPCLDAYSSKTSLEHISCSSVCTSSIKLIFEVDQSSKLLNDFKSKLIYIKRECSLNIKMKNLQSRKKKGDDYEYESIKLCVTDNCNSNSLYEDFIKDKERSIVKTCIRCERKTNLNDIIISDTCTKPTQSSRSNIDICFNKCFTISHIDRHRTITMQKGCLDDKVPYTLDKNDGVFINDGTWEYKLCLAKYEKACNTNDFVLAKTVDADNIATMNTFSNVTFCLSCFSSRYQGELLTNCELGEESSKFNIVECRHSCIAYTFVDEISKKINMVRGCVDLGGSQHISQQFLYLTMKSSGSLSPYRCNECYTDCYPRKEICNVAKFSNNFYDQNITINKESNANGSFNSGSVSYRSEKSVFRMKGDMPINLPRNNYQPSNFMRCAFGCTMVSRGVQAASQLDIPAASQLDIPNYLEDYNELNERERKKGTLKSRIKKPFKIITNSEFVKKQIKKQKSNRILKQRMNNNRRPFKNLKKSKAFSETKMKFTKKLNNMKYYMKKRGKVLALSTALSVGAGLIAGYFLKTYREGENMQIDNSIPQSPVKYDIENKINYEIVMDTSEGDLDYDNFLEKKKD